MGQKYQDMVDLLIYSSGMGRICLRVSVHAWFGRYRHEKLCVMGIIYIHLRILYWYQPLRHPRFGDFKNYQTGMAAAYHPIGGIDDFCFPLFWWDHAHYRYGTA